MPFDASLPPEANGLFRETNWRWSLAHEIVAGTDRRTRKYLKSDAGLATLVRHLQATNRSKTTKTRRSKLIIPAIDSALQLHQRNDPWTFEVQARILARQSDEEISTKCNLMPEVVNWYEQLFFDVREHLSARDYVVVKVCRRQIGGGFQKDDVAGLWKFYGYAYGPVMLDCFVDAFHAVWRPGDPVSLDLYFEERSPLPLETQAAIAVDAMCLDPYGWLEMGVRLQECEAIRDESLRRDAFLTLKKDLVQVYQQGSSAIGSKWKHRANSPTVKRDRGRATECPASTLKMLPKQQPKERMPENGNTYVAESQRNESRDHTQNAGRELACAGAPAHA